MGWPVAKDESFANPAVQAVFDAWPQPARDRLLTLRWLILETAAATEGVGPLDETLKWGQPSYLTPRSKSGSTIRTDRMKTGGYGLFFNCKTSLIETFRAHYPDDFRFAGNRGIEFGDEEPIPEQPLRHCIALALTYHLRKRGPSPPAGEGGPEGVG
jgi:Domain of unknown function (DU1801)